MNKVIKIFLSIVSSVVLAVIILPLLAMLLLYVPPVQSLMGNFVSTLATDKLGTRVTIDKFRITPFNNIYIEGLYVEDQHGRDTMLYVPKLHASFSVMRMMQEGVSINSATLESPRFHMHQDEDSTTNFKKILERLRGDNSRTTVTKFGRVRITDMTYTFRKLEVRPREYGVNFDDLAVSGFNLDASDIRIEGDSITLSIDDLSLKEKSGLVVNSFRIPQAIASAGAMRLDGLYILTPESELRMERLSFDYPAWQSFSDFVNQVRFEGATVDSKISFSTIAYFAPSLREWRSVVSAANMNVRGTVASMTGRVVSARVNDAPTSFRFDVRGLPDIDRTRFDIDMERLSATSEDVRIIASDVSKAELGPGLVETLNKLGAFDLRGKFAGTINKFSANARMTSQIGAANFNLTFNPTAGNRTAFSGNLRVDNMNLGTLVEAQNLGDITLVGSVDGSFGNDKLDGQAEMAIEKLDYNGYTYTDIATNGYFDNTYFKGAISSGDPNIHFDFDGMLDFNDSVPAFDFDIQMHNADLAKLNLVDRDSVSIVRGHVTARGAASSLDNFNGQVLIEDLVYINPVDSIRPGRVVVRGNNSPNSKLLELNSDFADAEFRSRLSYSEVAQGLKELLANYIPTLAPRDNQQQERVQQGANFNDYSLLSISVKESDNLADIFVPGLLVAKGSKLSFVFNPSTNRFTLTATSDYIEYKNNFVSKLNLDTHNNAQDSLTLFVNAEDLYTVGFYMPKLSVLGGAKDNKLTAIMRFQDDDKERSALLGFDATLGRSENNMPQILIRTTPSSFVNKGKRWNVYTRGITVDSTRISVNSFGIVSEGQHLQVNGIASRNVEDTLHVDLTNFDLDILTQFTENLGYHIGGRTSGNVEITSALKDGYMHAEIYTDSMTVNEILVPDLNFETAWDFTAEKADFTISDKVDSLEYLVGSYYPAEKSYEADVVFRSFDMALLDPLLKGVITNTSGTANANVKVKGVRNRLSVGGEIALSDLNTTVSYLKVPYTLTNTAVKIENNVISLSNAVLTDPEGNRADFSFDVNLSSLANITYNLDVKPHNMMVLNTSSLDNDLFYGKVYASGNALIRGDKAGVKMDVTASTSNNSEFYMPLSDIVSSAGADVITFINPAIFAADSSDYLRRKRMIMSGNRRRYVNDRSSMDINMTLDVQPNMDFQLLIDPKVGDILEGRGRGLLNIHVNPQSNEFTMFGEYEITEGSYQFTLQDIVSKRFQIEPGGSIVWSGEPMEAELNVSAVYKLRASLAPLLGAGERAYEGRMMVPVECRIVLTDKLSNPTVTFDVTLPGASPEIQILAADAMSTQESMANQFLFLVAARTFYSDDTGMSSIGSSAGNTIAFEMLSSQISNWISNDRFNIGFGYKRNEEFSSDEYNIDFSTQLFDNRLILEIEGNYDSGGARALENGNKDASNLTGNFYLTWLIDKAGNLRAKAFTRTIDRYENYGLQESGLGLYYKQDFDRFGDLMRNFRRRFRWRSNKRERQALEQQEAEAEDQVENSQQEVINFGQPEENPTVNEPENSILNEN